MVDLLKTLIRKYGGTYDQYDNTTLELYRRLASILNVPYSRYTSLDEFSEKVNAVVSESSGKSSSNASTWENINLDRCISGTDTKYYIASNGVDMYFSRSVSSENYTVGVYHLDLQTMVENKIFDTYFPIDVVYEASNGAIYVSSTNSTYKGMLYLTPTKATLIHNISCNWICYETSDGVIYCGSKSTIDGSGILRLNKTEYTEMTNEGYGWIIFFETSSGGLYISSDYLGGVKFIENGTLNSCTSDVIIREFTRMYETSKCYIYGVCDMSGCSGVFIFKGLEVKQLFVGSGYIIHEDLKGNVYALPHGTYYTPYHLDGETYTALSENTMRFCYGFYSDGNNCYVTLDDKFYHLDGTTMSLIVSTRVNNFYLHKGTLYGAHGNGVIIINGMDYTNLVLSNHGPENFFEDSKGNLYGYQTLNSIIVHITPTSITKIANVKYVNAFYIKDMLFIASEQKPTKDSVIAYIHDGTATEMLYSHALNSYK